MWKLASSYHGPTGWAEVKLRNASGEQITFLGVCGLLGTTTERRREEFVRAEARALICAEALNADELGVDDTVYVPMPEPIGKCRCGAPIYSEFGFCGVCQGE